MTTTFADLGLSQKVLEAVTASGYTIPTPIQIGAIPPALQRRDILGIAQTGTGKTAGFVLPMLTLLEKGRARARMPRTLILEPTRELAAQVHENFEKYGKNHKLNVSLLIGGVSFDEQDRKIERGADVLIATPGRLLDHMERGKLLMSGVEILVIDEADRMLDMGFIPDIERIAKVIPFTRQTLFFSATMPPEIQKLADAFLQNPVRVEVAARSSAAKTVAQRLVACQAKDYEKRSVLRDLIRAQTELKNAIIFCNRKVDVAELFRSLERHGFSVGALHGDMDQRSRTAMLASFKEGNLQLLVASDVAARGLDIPDVSHVFNFDVPIHAEDYVHRIGRTGRAGRSGQAFTLVTKRDTKFLDAIEKLIGEKIEWESGNLGELPEMVDDGQDRDKGRGRGRSGDKGGRGEKSGRGGSDRGGRGADRASSGHGRGRVEKTVEIQSAHKNDIEPVHAVVDSEPPPAKAAPMRAEKTHDQPIREYRPYPANDDNRRRRRNEDNEPNPVGFGDDIPAFMLVSAAGK